MKIFKVAFKANGEIIDEEITNLFNSHSWIMHQIGEITTRGIFWTTNLKI